MEPPIFYVPPAQLTLDLIRLPATEAKHAAKVMRLRKGDLVMIIDGVGGAARAEITKCSCDGKVVEVSPIDRLRNFGEPLVKLTLAAGLSTGSKFDEVVKRGTELGVSRFVPLLTASSKVKIEEPKRVEARQKRLEKVALSAAKQCRRSVCPTIALPLSLDEYLAEADADCLLLFHPGPARPLMAVLSTSNIRRVAVLIGPESGFTGEEVNRAVGAGFHPISLGPRILRTETAGPVAAALVMGILEELN